jgi:hypothetical protein
MPPRGRRPIGPATRLFSPTSTDRARRASEPPGWTGCPRRRGCRSGRSARRSPSSTASSRARPAGSRRRWRMRSHTPPTADPPIRRVGARLSRAQDVVGYVAVPATVRQTVGRGAFLYIAANVENLLFCRDEYVPRLLVNIRAITSMKSRRLAASMTPHSDQQARENARRAAVLLGHRAAATSAVLDAELDDLRAGVAGPAPTQPLLRVDFFPSTGPTGCLAGRAGHIRLPSRISSGGHETWLRLIRQPPGGGLHIASRYDRGPAIRSQGLLLCTRGPDRFPPPAGAGGRLQGGDQAQLVRISVAAGRCAC